MKHRTTRLALGCVALGALALASGCGSTPRRYTFEPEDSTAIPAEAPELARPVKVAVKPYGHGPLMRLHDTLATALRNHPGVEVIRRADRDSLARADYHLDFDLGVSGDGKAINFLTCFPGFVIGMPNWFRLRWELKLRTLAALRAADGTPLGEVDRNDVYEMAYSSSGYLIACHTGWGALLLSPLLGAPLGAGIASVFDGADLEAFDRTFTRSRAGRSHAKRIADAAIGLIAADLEAHPEPRREALARKRAAESSKAKARRGVRAAR
jgi:hypothetical protein